MLGTALYIRHVIPRESDRDKVVGVGSGLGFGRECGGP